MIYRIRNFFIIAAVMIAAFVLQYTVISRLDFLECAPNLLLVLTVTYGYSRGKNSGMIIGFFGGLMADIFYCEVIGYNALILVAIGFFAALWRSRYFSNTLFIPMTILVISDIGYNLIYYFIWYVLNSEFYFTYSVIHVMLPNFLLTIVAGLILYKPLLFLNSKLYMYYDMEEDL